MDVDRVRREVDELRQDYPVKWSVEKSYVMITQYGYPEGWSPRTAPLFFSLPSIYPRQPPEIWIPPEMEYEGSRPDHQHHRNDDGWWRWCIVRLDWKPRHHRLYTLVEMMEQSLSNPDDRRLAGDDTYTNGLRDLLPGLFD